MTSGLGHEDVVGNLIKKGFFEGSVLFEWVKKKKEMRKWRLSISNSFRKFCFRMEKLDNNWRNNDPAKKRKMMQKARG